MLAASPYAQAENDADGRAVTGRLPAGLRGRDVCRLLRVGEDRFGQGEEPERQPEDRSGQEGKRQIKDNLGDQAAACDGNGGQRVGRGRNDGRGSAPEERDAEQQRAG
jgi:hypothetical protein